MRFLDAKLLSRVRILLWHAGGAATWGFAPKKGIITDAADFHEIFPAGEMLFFPTS